MVDRSRAAVQTATPVRIARALPGFSEVLNTIDSRIEERLIIYAAGQMFHYETLKNLDIPELWPPHILQTPPTRMRPILLQQKCSAPVGSVLSP